MLENAIPANCLTCHLFDMPRNLKNISYSYSIIIKLQYVHCYSILFPRHTEIIFIWPIFLFFMDSKHKSVKIWLLSPDAL